MSYMLHLALKIVNATFRKISEKGARI